MKKIFNILLVGLVCVSLASCEKDFELQRPNQAPWQNVSELELAVQAPYLMITERPWANALGMMALSGFGESDIAMYLTGMSGDSYYYAYDARSFNKLVLGNMKELEGAFIYLYAMSTDINAALQLIEDAEKAGKDPFENMSDADRAKVKQYKGELLFLRGVTYWYLARKWCPPYNEKNNKGKYIVYNTTYVNSAEKIKKPTLATVEEIYNGIISDLEAAANLLPAEYDNDGGKSARMRANKYAAKALEARVLFYMGAEANKAKIKTLLDEVIGQSSLYDLSEEPYAAFSKIGNGYGKETIWQICYDSSSERFDRNPGIFNYYAYNTSLYGDGSPKSSGYIAFAMSFAALMQIGWADATCHVTAAAEADKRFQQLYKKCDDPTTVYYKAAQLMPGKPDLVFLWKYFRGATQGAKAERRANRPVIRLADMVLMRAQINLMLGYTSDALTDINAVRQRAGLDKLTTVTYDDIEKERIKEMAGENADRMNWLIGLRKPIPIGNRDATKFQPMTEPYSDMYYQVPVLEQQTNEAYRTE